MKITNKFVEVEVPDETKDSTITLRFLITKAKISLNANEALNLWKALDMMYGRDL